MEPNVKPMCGHLTRRNLEDMYNISIHLSLLPTSHPFINILTIL